EMPVLNTVDPWIALAAIAMSTGRIKIGTTVTPLPRRRPWKVARETVSLDRLSGGRLVLGVGIGLGELEWDNLGEESDPKVRGPMLDEALDVLAGLWRGEPFSYEGRFYRVKDAHFIPAPVQQPRIPVWVGGFWPNKAPMRRAARWDGVFPLFYELEGDEVAHLRDTVAYVREHRDSDAPFDVIAMGSTFDADPVPAAATVARYAEAGATWWLELLTAWYPGCTELRTLDALRARVRQGPPKG
ncbi:MAG: LLM class flavin-dependent oxidoreductase, partial [Anaerolineae bacterium]|nr:LLM class flavin-dependent oxidoreductase [Anaerolineae bacterium]